MLTTARRSALLTAMFVVAAILCSSAQTERVYVTKTGEKYHRESCRSLAKSKIEMPLAQAAARFGACKVCRPPTAAVTTASSAGSVTPAPAAPAVRSRCQATTKKGTQCSRTAQTGRSFCYQH